jgi:hypothetical protein
VCGIIFSVQISATNTKDAPPGYLFLCPENDLQTEASSFRWPHCAAYWSVDPVGVQCLSQDEATELGFPSIQLSTTLELQSWDASVYAGLRQFHQAKGFDPDSQDVARHRGYPLFRPSAETTPLFAHGRFNFSVNETANCSS